MSKKKIHAERLRELQGKALYLCPKCKPDGRVFHEIGQPCPGQPGRKKQ